MPSWSNSPAAPRKIGVLLFEGFSNHCLANTVEPLRAVNTLSRRVAYEWRYLTLDAAPVTSSSGLSVSPHGALSEARGDILAVMPSYGFREHARWRSLAALRSAALRFDVLAGLDTGSWLLAEAGLLEGYRATIHWQELEGFAERFPNVDAVRERYVIDRDRFTCSGAMAAFDMILDRIGEVQGQAMAVEVAQMFMTRGSHRSHDGGASPTGRSINRALAVMQANLETPLPVSRLAREAGCTQKTLEARFRAALGATPQQVYRRQRLVHARKLVAETDLSIAEITLRSGYADASAMTRAFKSEFGIPPRQMRRGDGVQDA